MPGVTTGATAGSDPVATLRDAIEGPMRQRGQTPMRHRPRANHAADLRPPGKRPSAKVR